MLGPNRPSAGYDQRSIRSFKDVAEGLDGLQLGAGRGLVLRQVVVERQVDDPFRRGCTRAQSSSPYWPRPLLARCAVEESRTQPRSSRPRQGSWHCASPPVAGSLRGNERSLRQLVVEALAELRAVRVCGDAPAMMIAPLQLAQNPGDGGLSSSRHRRFCAEVGPKWLR